MRTRWWLAAAAAAGLTWWSPVVVAQSGPTCTSGCPCGNTCISCSDTCRIGGGTATNGTRSGSGSDPTLIVLLVVGSSVVALGSLLSVFFLPVLCPAKPPASPYKGKEPCRTDEMCPSGYFCATEDAFSVGVCEPTARDEVPPKPESEDEPEWFGFVQAPNDGMTMVR